MKLSEILQSNVPVENLNTKDFTPEFYFEFIKDRINYPLCINANLYINNSFELNEKWNMFLEINNIMSVFSQIIYINDLHDNNIYCVLSDAENKVYKIFCITIVED